MRGDAPLVEQLMSEHDNSNYSVAIDTPKNARKWMLAAGVPLVISVLSLLDTFKFPR